MFRAVLFPAGTGYAPSSPPPRFPFRDFSHRRGIILAFRFISRRLFMFLLAPLHKLRLAPPSRSKYFFLPPPCSQFPFANPLARIFFQTGPKEKGESRITNATRSCRARDAHIYLFIRLTEHRSPCHFAYILLKYIRREI